MNENVNDKIDIDILKERPLHDVLASIFVVIGICREVVLDGLKLGYGQSTTYYNVAQSSIK